MENTNTTTKTERGSVKDISTNTNRKVQRTNQILNYIKENAPITPYKLSKKLGINYTDVHRTVKELEFVGLIKTRIVIGENNRACKLIILDDGCDMKIEKEGKNGEEKVE